MNNVEKIAKNVALTHFFLMFGYKMFSLYFPLYLVEKHFSLPQVGYSTFFLYLPIALFAPVAGFLNHRVNARWLVSAGVLGYGLYCLGIISFPNFLIFSLLQVMLGISAALFFVTTRSLLMDARFENHNKAFAWFYLAPSYADALAPLFGALVLWRFGFTGVFTVSAILQLFTALFAFLWLRKNEDYPVSGISLKQSAENYRSVLSSMRQRNIGWLVGLSFLILIVGGFSGTFFVLFLKNLGWSRNTIVWFNAFLSLAFVAMSYLSVKFISKASSARNIYIGSFVSGIFYILLGGLAGILNIVSLFFIMIGNSVGGLMTGTGRSALMAVKLKKYPKESAAVDTIFSPFSTAIGGLLGGFAVAAFGYPAIFIAGGLIIILAGFFIRSKKIS